MSHYNLKLDTLTKLSDIKFNNNSYYRYKNVSFYYKTVDESDILIVSFHGSLSQSKTSKNGLTELPVFRGYNWNFNILCLSDRLLEDFTDKNLRVAWFLNYESIYIEIIKFISQKYKKIVFVGSSGGGLPSLVFATYFNQYALIANTQIYINKTDYINTLLKITNFKLEELNIDIEKILLSYKPKLVHFYQNTNDLKTYNRHVIPFLDFIRKEQIDNIDIKLFPGDEPKYNQTNHDIRFPNSQDWNIQIKNFINVINEY
jgi:hypothetical protein